jgi:hypothetical protein
MTDAGFEKLTGSRGPLYGPRGLVLCGFSAEAQPKFMKVLSFAGLDSTAAVWPSSQEADTSLAELLAKPHGTGWGHTSDLPRAVVVSGITEAELQRLMAVCRQAGMKQALWATLTPTSEHWPLKRLLSELLAEREALSERK